jgi:L,D-peptidoglycan transpeptidase YkuD (ErfK/YbiS/YcfS/YnhG family)
MVLVRGAKIGSTTGTLSVLNLINGAWVEQLSVPARFGRNGLIDGVARREGSGTTPTGIWLIPDYTFGTHAQAPAGTRMGYRQITPHSWWSSLAGASYNTWVEADSWTGEHLADYPSAYEFAVSTGYNALPNESVYGRGSAIFLHVQGSGLTAGCVAIDRSGMIRVCSLLDPARRPVFVVGTQDGSPTTGVDSYLKSVNQVRAGIDALSPSPATVDTPVSFVGHASDPGSAIAGWQWRSSIDGALGDTPSFTRTLSRGVHVIYLMASNAQGTWSPEVSTTILVGGSGTKPVPVYRFYNARTATHFYTASEAEKNSIVANLSSIYSLEGMAYAIDAASPKNGTPLYRFYNPSKGVHFYTASEAEKNEVISRLSGAYKFEGVAYNVCGSPVSGATPVYRFYNRRVGVHFYTASTAERDVVINRYGDTYSFEGTAYWYASP